MSILPQKLKAAISPVDFYRYELPDMPQTSRQGWVDGGLCPFHADKHTGSFRVNLESGAYRCFSCDAKGGDILSFLQARDGVSFPEALKRISQEWGL